MARPVQNHAIIVPSVGVGCSRPGPRESCGESLQDGWKSARCRRHYSGIRGRRRPVRDGFFPETDLGIHASGSCSTWLARARFGRLAAMASPPLLVQESPNHSRCNQALGHRSGRTARSGTDESGASRSLLGRAPFPQLRSFGPRSPEGLGPSLSLDEAVADGADGDDQESAQPVSGTRGACGTSDFWSRDAGDL